MLNLDQGGKSPPRDFVRPPAVATLPGARGLLEAPLDDMATHYVCGSRGALGALSLSRWRKVSLPLEVWQES